MMGTIFFKQIFTCLFTPIFIFMLTACAAVSTPSKADPFESFNRVIFEFNETADRLVLKPVAHAYNFVLPAGVRTSVSNFFSNIGDIYTMANDFLQGRVMDGTQDLVRVGMNTLFGVVGLFDVATVAGLPKHRRDFGQTLGTYGLSAGPYLVLPLLGPSTIRDTIGFVADRSFDPTTYVNPVALRNEVYGAHLISTRAGLLQTTSLISDVALDRYSFVRNAYLQRREYLIRGNDQALPNYDDNDAPAEMTVPPAQILPPSNYFPTFRLN
jgi:phospholipid-binding lipoprotein MlaA